MIIPLLKWGDISAKVGEDVAVLLTYKQQYTLMQLLSLMQQNPEQMLTDFTETDREAIDDFNDACMNALLADNVVHQSKQHRIWLSPAFTDAVVGTLSWVSLTTQPQGGYWTFATPAINNSLRWDQIPMKQGYWICEMLVVTNTNMGIAELSLDGDVFASVDLYSAAAAVNVKKVTSSFIINWDTEFSNFKIRMHTKNASSSNYQIDVSHIQFHRILDYP